MSPLKPIYGQYSLKNYSIVPLESHFTYHPSKLKLLKNVEKTGNPGEDPEI